MPRRLSGYNHLNYEFCIAKTIRASTRREPTGKGRIDYENICFVVMPFGTRDVGGVQVDFDHIYETVLKPAVDGARTPEGEVLQARRTDHDFFSGLITQDMFDYLEFSRLVLADITSLNANVFYELGIRHTLRESGTIIVRQPGVTLPFDIRMAKAFPYEYQPDESAEESRQLIRKVVAESLVEERLDSPVQATMRFHRKRSQQTEALALAVENEVRQLDPWGAITRLRDLIKRPDATAFDRMKLGLLLKEQGDWDEAIQLFTEVTVQLPEYAEAWRERGIAENKTARADAAADAPGEISLRRSIALNLNDFDAHASLGGVLKRAGRREEALESYEAANRYSNSHPYPFLNMLKLRAALHGTLALSGADLRTLQRARRLRFAQSEAKQDEPWSHFDAAELCLLDGDLPEALMRLRLGVAASTAEFQIDTFKQSLELLLEVQPPVIGLPELLAELH